MAEKKSIVEQALLQVNSLEEAVKQNAKGILAATMKQELSSLLKEQENEDEIDPEDNENDVPDETGDETMNDELPNNEEPSTEESDEEPSIDGEEDFEGGEEEDDDVEGLEDDDESSEEDDDEVLDLTNASSEEVARIFKAMKPEDGIIVKKEGDNLELNVEEPGEYIIKLDEQMEGDEINDENIYEIELDDDDDNESFTGEFDEEKNDPYSIKKGEVVKSPTLPLTKDQNTQKGGGKKNDPFTTGKGEPVKSPKMPFTKPENKQGGKGGDTDPFNKTKGDAVKNPGIRKGEQTEAARTKSNPHGNKNGQNRTGLPSKKVFKAGSNINEEVETLKKQNGEYKKALILFKEKLNEVAVFNANLAYATRLFTEHTTTKKEKLDILKRFDTISTITESKNLYGTIKQELDIRKPITETVADKIASPTKTKSSTEMLTESKAYINPQFERMKSLMGINKNK